MSQSTAGVVERLRRQIEVLQAQPRAVLMALRTGVAEIDALGLFRLGGGVELAGEEASGRTTLALTAVASACREKRLAAWVDGPHELYPPAALSLGVELERLLIVRPKATGSLVWAAVQLLRSGAFTCVVLDVTRTGVVLSLIEAKKLVDAARAGGSLLVLLTAPANGVSGLPRLVLRQVPGPRVVGPGEGDEGPLLELSAPHGRRARVRKSGLAVDRAAPPRRAYRLWAPPEALAVGQRPSLQRPRKNLLRDGYPGLPGVSGRPGREGPLHLPSEGAARPGPHLVGRNWR